MVYSPVEDCYLSDHEEANMESFVSIDGEPWRHDENGDYIWLFDDIEMVTFQEVALDYYDNYDCIIEEMLKYDFIVSS